MVTKLKSSIKLRIVLAFGALAIIISTIFGVTLYTLTLSQAYISLDKEILYRAETIDLNSLTSQVGDYQPKTGGQPILVNFLSPNGTYLESLPSFDLESDEETSRKRTIFLSLDKLPLNTAINQYILSSERKPKFFNVNLNDDSWRIYAVKSLNSKGTLLLGRNTLEQHEVLERILSKILYLTLIVFLTALLLGFILAKLSLRSFSNFINFIKNIDPVSNIEIPYASLGSRDETLELENAFNLLALKINQLKKEDRELIENVSHELKTPLTSILTNASLLQEKLTKKDLAEVSQAIMLEVRELNDIVNSLLLLNDTREKTIEPLDFNDLMNEIVSTWAPRGMVIETLGQGKLQSNKDILKIVINSLIENAKKFSEQSKVTVSFKEGELLTTLTVQDYGPGVEDEDLKRIFQRFYRPINSHAKPGSGLGLAIVEQLLHKVGAEIIAENANGLKLTITIKNRTA